MNKKLILSISALTLVLSASVLSLNKANAEEISQELPPFMQGLVANFGLNTDEVKTYLNENRPERQGGPENKGAGLEERLNTAVTAGTITEDQKTALLEKHQELMEDRQSAREQFKAWAEEQGINTDELLLGAGMGMEKGRGQKQRICN